MVVIRNHDLNNPRAYGYRGNERYPAERTTPEQFRQIYGEFGYDEAVSEDATTLSYVWQLDGMTRLLMLDTCQYRDGNRVGGVILTETYDWIEEQLEEAWEEGMNIIPVAHHNLLEESEVYTVDCTIEHSEQLWISWGSGMSIFSSAAISTYSTGWRRRTTISMRLSAAP